MGQLLPSAYFAGLFLSMNEAQKFSGKIKVLGTYYMTVINIGQLYLYFAVFKQAQDSPDAAQETLSVSRVSIHLPAVCCASVPLPPS